jgi:hypothetical protein
MDANLQIKMRRVKDITRRIECFTEFLTGHAFAATLLSFAAAGLDAFSEAFPALRVVSRNVAFTTFTKPNIVAAPLLSFRTLVGRESGQGCSNARVAEVDCRFPLVVSGTCAAFAEECVQHRLFPLEVQAVARAAFEIIIVHGI